MATTQIIPLAAAGTYAGQVLSEIRQGAESLAARLTTLETKIK